MKLRSQKGQTAVEWALVISVVVIAFYAGFMLLKPNSAEGPTGTSFKNFRDTVESPYP
jgi:hypothetical protein